MKSLPYGRHSIDQSDIDAVVEVLRGDWLTTGPSVDAFEEGLRAITSAEYVVACSSGTAALHLALDGLGIGSGDQVVVPSITFSATANAARYVGATPVFADVDPDTGLMTPKTLLAAIERAGAVAAAIPVHLAGQACDMREIASVCRDRNIKIVEDACHAIGGTIDEGEGSSAIGACVYSDAAAFSFHPVKTIAMGEGGAVSTSDSAVDASMRLLRHHGIRRREDGFLNKALSMTGDDVNPWYYEVDELGFNYRASDIHCALGLSQLRKIRKFVDRRSELTALYIEELASLAPVVRPLGRRGNGNTAWHLFVALIDFEQAGTSRAAVMRALARRGIGSQVHYIPLHLMPTFQEFADGTAMPGAMSYYNKCLSLPLYPGMEAEDLKVVVSALRHAING